MSTERERVQLLAWAFGNFERFCGLLDIVPKDGRRCKFQLNAIQKLFCIERTGRDIALKPRQVGFTTLEQARDVWHFLTVPGARVVTTCQSLQDNTPLKLLAGNYRVMFEGLERAGLSLKFRTQSATEWTLADRDASLRIVVAGASEASAAKKGRAGTISRLHCTETAFYEFADDTLNALLECVPSRELGSEIISESTANGAAGYFYQQCQNAKNGLGAHKLHFYPWFQQAEYAVPLDPGEVIRPASERETLLVSKGVTPEQLKWYRQKVADKGQSLVDQEYPSDPDTCFLMSGRGFFDRATTEKLIERTSEPIELRDRGRVKIWAKPESGRRYVIGADTSEGGGGDPSGALVYDWQTGEHVATIFGQYVPYELARVLAELGREYNDATIAVERNNHGHAVLQALQREQRYKKIYEHDDEKLGWPTNAVTRPVMLDLLEDAHRRGLWKTSDRDVLSQFRTFIVGSGGKPEAANNEHDDLVMAAAIGWAARALRKPATYAMA